MHLYGHNHVTPSRQDVLTGCPYVDMYASSRDRVINQAFDACRLFYSLCHHSYMTDYGSAFYFIYTSHITSLNRPTKLMTKCKVIRKNYISEKHTECSLKHHSCSSNVPFLSYNGGQKALNKVLLFKSIHPSLQNNEYFITKTITSTE
jgi:hypothetical protein